MVGADVRQTSDQPNDQPEAAAPHYHGHRERLRERFLTAPDRMR